MSKDLTTTKMGKDFCPHCNYELDAASSIEGEIVPVPGDVSICINCGEFLEFASDMALTEITRETLNDLTEDQLSQLMRIKEFILKRGPLKEI